MTVRIKLKALLLCLPLFTFCMFCVQHICMHSSTHTWAHVTPSSLSPTHIDTYTHTCAHTHYKTYTHTTQYITHKHMCTHTHTLTLHNIHTHYIVHKTHTHTHNDKHTHIYPLTHSHLHTHVQQQNTHSPQNQQVFPAGTWPLLVVSPCNRKTAHICPTHRVSWAARNRSH